MSSTRAPRLRSFTGLARPWSIGPMLITRALRCTALYVVLPVSRSGKMKTLARPATGLPGRLAWPTEAIAAASYCSGPSTARPGSRWRTIRVASATLSTSVPGPGGPGAEADHRDPGLDAEGTRRRGAGDGDVGQVLRAGLGIDGAVAVDDHLVGQAHEENRGHQAAARLGAQDLQRGADGGRRGVHRAGHQAVHLALPEHHGADRDRVGEMLAGHLLGPALVPPQFGQRGDVALGDGPRVQDGDAGRQPQPDVPGLRGHLVRGAEQQAAGDAAVGALDRGVQGPGFGAFGQDDE